MEDTLSTCISLFSKTSCFVNIAIKGLEFFLCVAQPPTCMCFVLYDVRRATSLCLMNHSGLSLHFIIKSFLLYRKKNFSFQGIYLCLILNQKKEFILFLLVPVRLFPLCLSTLGGANVIYMSWIKSQNANAQNTHRTHWSTLHFFPMTPYLLSSAPTKVIRRA